MSKSKGKGSSDNVMVMVRVRPFNKREEQEGATEIIEMDKTLCTVTLHKPVEKGAGSATSECLPSKKVFTYDAVYPSNSTQVEVFDESVREMIDGCLEGYNATVFAYGQTGSGKTHTMMGQKDNPGMIPLAFQRIFDFIAQAKDDQFLVRASFVEIYNEDLKDLLTGATHLQLKEDPVKGVFIKDLSEHPVSDERHIDKLIQKGNESRAVAATLMNATSSRSHSIFQVVLERMTVIDGRECIRVGKLNLVDLAGSERQEKTGATGDRLKEAAKINLSLTTLGCVISKLVEGSKHIPYRDSKLTRLLQDSLGGNSKTLMVVAVSPASTNYDETMSTLRYADRAKQIKNKPRINEDPKDAQIREMRNYVTKLEAQLAEIMQQANAGSGSEVEDKEAYDGEGNMGAGFTGYTADEMANVQSLRKNLDKTKKKRVKYVEQRKENEEAVSAEELATLEEEQKKLEEQIKESERKAKERQLMAKKIAALIEANKSKMVDKKVLENEERLKDAAIREARNALVAQKKEAERLKKELIEAEQQRKQLEEQCTTALDQAQQLELRLNEYKEQLAERREELHNVEADQAKEREIIRNDYADQIKLCELRQFIVSMFVPEEYQRSIESIASWDEDNQAWHFRIQKSHRGMAGFG